MPEDAAPARNLPRVTASEHAGPVPTPGEPPMRINAKTIATIVVVAALTNVAMARVANGRPSK